MEFYSATKKNEILSFTSKWMEPKNSILREVSRLRRPKIICSSSYMEYSPKTNALILLDMSLILMGEHAWEK
jgi:hypothetical protein